VGGSLPSASDRTMAAFCPLCHSHALLSRPRVRSLYVVMDSTVNVLLVNLKRAKEHILAGINIDFLSRFYKKAQSNSRYDTQG